MTTATEFAIWLVLVLFTCIDTILWVRIHNRVSHRLPLWPGSGFWVVWKMRQQKQPPTTDQPTPIDAGEWFQFLRSMVVANLTVRAGGKPPTEQEINYEMRRLASALANLLMRI